MSIFIISVQLYNWGYFNIGVGPDGSSGHEFGKRITGKSLLDGAAMVTTFCSIQFVTEVDNQTIILYTNRLLGAANNVRPWHINVVPESPGEFRLIEIIRLNILKKKWKCLKIIQKFFLLLWHDCLQEI